MNIVMEYDKNTEKKLNIKYLSKRGTIFEAREVFRYSCIFYELTEFDERGIKEVRQRWSENNALNLLKELLDKEG